MNDEIETALRLIVNTEHKATYDHVREVAEEALTEITRLRADKAALVEALEEICDATLGWDVDHTNARAAILQAKAGAP